MQGWMLVLVVAVGLVWVGLTLVLIALLLEEGRAWANQRRRQQQLTDDAVRYAEQRALQQRIRGLVDDERRRQLTATLHTPRSFRSGEPQ